MLFRAVFEAGSSELPAAGNIETVAALLFSVGA
jgi:hypothetical protein